MSKKQKTIKSKSPLPVSGFNPFSGYSRFGKNPQSITSEVKSSTPKQAPQKPVFITQHKGGN